MAASETVVESKSPEPFFDYASVSTEEEVNNPPENNYQEIRVTIQEPAPAPASSPLQALQSCSENKPKSKLTALMEKSEEKREQSPILVTLPSPKQKPKKQVIF